MRSDFSSLLPGILIAFYVVDGVCLDGRRIIIAGTEIMLDAPAPAAKDEKVKLGVRPEHWSVAQTPEIALPAQVDFAEYLGSTRYVHCRLASGDLITIDQRADPEATAGEHLWL